jgi:hypothetical protein
MQNSELGRGCGVAPFFVPIILPNKKINPKVDFSKKKCIFAVIKKLNN